ncbi:bifunctional diaminohydroxyphosphoribosylaminopyrimidine deaminase/5-amino-6-(5-phosphoribosylamino)uracil reductase RibD [Rhodopirellula sp. MGV]|uniref:bifunctional diaminohydroxyphosphoribosylaminopyrimidine deaminase/5-amino-6-(5-phosphoribosylamino)uracil reductase RibD n=1 Tax=Rhodopirellula sp. MGV TaxID=2023130 RepID=UPI000B972C06|nr:bifunctional diaminohydroxyphosphoribosylaminopyrimidine deaminase/5-amino-6-(5-phosphoribosylamino)uracil reductase RibD [Rhodopirellula sp. MGV]OYP28364.1 riboflavin biosynthesis protein RibD [Rhodopirellula sp. MGV]PNY38760.1 bifunctional diaminohydroxyphosphoribosylaminopyrimidine deaminase/5-amino-6-(5-phosphoribosylamino)uracil reductase RibD [Rhodopirellula baltica]
MPVSSQAATTHRDELWMRKAIALAELGEGFVEPNPMVGCVIIKDGQCIGQGYHQRFGGPHAEIEALRSLNSPADAESATAYVTLEPCCHHGKTPPCSQALIDAKIGRVVIAMQDPFPKVAGGGLAQLRDHGIDVTVGVQEVQAKRLNAPYLKRLRTGQPWTIAKWAMTIDGRVATTSGESQWISGPQSRSHVHRLRGRVDGILVGMGTVLADDPMLNARLTDADGNPATPPRVAKRMIFSRGRLPPVDSKLVQSAKDIPTYLFTSPFVNPDERAQLESLGIICFAENDSLPDILGRCASGLPGQEPATNVMIEGGPNLMASLIGESADECLIDEIHAYVGPKLFGGATAPGPILGSGIAQLAQTPQFTLDQVDKFDDDVRLIYRRQ